MSSKELKLAAKVEKKQKRRQEKDAKKEKRKERKEEKKEKRRLKKLEKKRKEEREKEPKKTDKLGEHDIPEKPKTAAAVASSIGDKAALQFLATFGTEPKKQKKDKERREKSKKEHKKDHRSNDTEHKPNHKQEEISSNKKPKLENFKKHISIMGHFKPAGDVAVSVSVAGAGAGAVKLVSGANVPTPVATPVPTPVATPVPTPVATPVPTPVAKPVPTPVAKPVAKPVATPVATLVSQSKTTSTVTDTNTSNSTASPATTTVRKPIGIRTPGANREINPIYTKPVVNNSGGTGEFIIPGVNDTEESKILTRTFADKWYLPANLYKIEASTGLKYKRGRFSDPEKLLAMKLTTKFCQEQNMTLERFKTIFFDDMGTENGHQNRLSNFFVDVSQHFGGRPVVAVYDFLKRLYHPGNHRGTWTAEDDQVLLREYQKHGPKWTLIGKELNRLGINCRDRYNVRWKHEGKAVSGPWTLEEDEKLTSAIKNSIEASGTISWLWISEESVKTRTPLQCVNRWKYLQDRSTKIPATPVVKKPKEYWSGWKEDEDYLLIHSILTSGAASDDTIQWKNLSVPGVPAPRHNPELFFRRWNHLKTKAEIPTAATTSSELKETVEMVKKYLVKLSKSPAYIFSEDEDDDI